MKCFWFPTKDYFSQYSICMISLFVIYNANIEKN